MTDLDVHPAADVWPMLPDDELKALAESITEIGLLEPIVLDADGRILDGRNRLRACDLAGVEPTFVTSTADPVAYVLARNEHRRHMSKGARAMSAWMTAQHGANNLQTEVAAAAAVSHTAIGWAKVVADSAPDLVAAVISGAQPLKDAYDQARKIRDAADSQEARFTRLDTAASDLAEQVREESLTLDEAEAALKAREKKRADDQRDARSLIDRAVVLLAPVDTDPYRFATEWAAAAGPIPAVTRDRLRNGVAILTELLAALETE